MSKKQLLRMISQAKDEGWERLDLSSQRLNILPPEIGQLTNLVSLNIFKNALTELPPELGDLTSLRSLDIHTNKLTQLPPEIGQLTSLRFVDLSNNQLTRFPSEIVKLTNLRFLDLSDNDLPHLPADINQLSSLILLDLSNNKLTKLPSELGELIRLQYLDLPGNQLAELPIEMQQLSSLSRLYLKGNPLPLPPEALEYAISHQSLLKHYIEPLAKANEARPLNEAKMLVLGEGEVGKTSLIHAIENILKGEQAETCFDPYQPMTKGIIIKQWLLPQFKGMDIRLNVWDFGGQEIMHATHQFFLTERSIYVIVLAARKDSHMNRLDYWLKMVESYGGNSPIIVVVNKTDQYRMRLPEDEWIARYPNIAAFIETSCAKGTGIQELLGAIQVAVDSMPHVRDPLPMTWFNVKERLTKMRDNAIPYSRYQKMCVKERIKDHEEQRTLLRFLHHLGTVLHFENDPALDALGVLNPAWVTDAAYKILNTDKINNSDGILHYEDLSDILDKSYLLDHYNFILELLARFEVLFRLERTTYLVPDLLPPTRPLDLSWDEHDNLLFRIQYDVLPGSILSRFIVRAQHYLEGHRYWRTGAVLQRDGCRALVRGDLNQNLIDIAVVGPKHLRRDFLSDIRAELRNIQLNLKGLGVTELVPIPGHPEAAPVSYEHLLSLYVRGRNDYDPVGLHQSFPVKWLLDGVASPQQQQADLARVNLVVHGDLSGKLNLSGHDVHDVDYGGSEGLR